jgi:hypothetical protein
MELFLHCEPPLAAKQQNNRRTELKEQTCNTALGFHIRDYHFACLVWNLISHTKITILISGVKE